MATFWKHSTCPQTLKDETTSLVVGVAVVVVVAAAEGSFVSGSGRYSGNGKP